MNCSSHPLANGYWQMVIGRWLLADGYWQMVIPCHVVSMSPPDMYVFIALLPKLILLSECVIPILIPSIFF